MKENNMFMRLISTFLMIAITFSTYFSLYGMSFGFEKQVKIRTLMGRHLNKIVDLRNVIDYSFDEEKNNVLKFELSDGSTTSYTFSEPVVYKEKGIIKGKDMLISKQLDNNLKSKGYAFATNQNNYKSNFSPDIEKCVKVENNNYSYTLIPISESDMNLSGVVKNDGTFFEYPSAFTENSFLRFYPQLNGLKEEIILNKFEGKNEFTFKLEVENCVPKLSKDGLLVLTQIDKKDDDRGETVVESFTPIFAYDSKNDGNNEGVHFTKDCYYSLEKQNENTYYLKIIVSKEWLESKETVYPVIIDPTSENISDLEDTQAYSNSPTNNYGTSGTMNVGRGFSSTAIYRSFIKFNLPSDITESSIINSAYFWGKRNLGAVTTVTTRIVTENWRESTLTWNNQPAFSSNIISTKTMPAAGDNSQNTDGGIDDSWYKFDLKTAIEYWKDGNPNYGFMIKESETTGYSRGEFYSKEATTSAYRPYTVINYTNERLSPEYDSVTGEEENWRTGTMSLTVNGARDIGNAGLHEKAYSFSNDRYLYNWQASNVSPAYDSPQTVFVYIRDANGNKTYCGSYDIKADNQGPTLKKTVKSTTEWTKEPITLTVNGATDNGIGLNSAAYSFSTEEDVYDWQSNNSKSFDENGTVYVYLRDALGNISLADTVEINNIDKEAPIVTGYSHERLSDDTYKLTVTANDNGKSGVKDYSFDGGKNWQDSNVKIVSSLQGVLVKVRDNLGNIGEYFSTQPTGLSLVHKSDNSAIISWNGSLGNIVVNKYNIYQNGELIGSTTTKTSFEVTGLTNNTEYSFYVEAIDANGKVSEPSNILSFTTGLEEISGVETVCGMRSIKLIWNPCYGVTNYDVQIDDTLTTNVEGTSYVFTGLGVNTTHTVKVRPRHSDVVGTFCDPISLTTQDASMVSGTIITNKIYYKSYSPYLVTGDLTIKEGASLTIRAGTVLKVDPGCKIIVNGKLIIEGTSSLPVVITSESDEKYGGTGASEWGGIVVNSTGEASISYTTIRYANSNEAIASSLVSNGKLTLDHSIIEKCNSMLPLYVTNDVTLTNNKITMEAENLYGVGILHTTSDKDCVVTGNTILSNEYTENPGFAFDTINSETLTFENNTVGENVVLSLAVYLDNFTPKTFSGWTTNTFNGLIELIGELKTDFTLPNNSAIALRNDLTIAENKTLNIGEGSVFFVDKDVKVIVNGTLNSLGTSENGNIFTGVIDTTQASGDDNDYWKGFYVSSTGTLNMNCSSVHYAGGTSDESSIRSEGYLSLNNSSIRHTFGCGVMLIEDNTTTEKNIVITNNVISDTKNGIYAAIIGNADLEIKNNRIQGSQEIGVRLFMAGYGTVLPDDNQTAILNDGGDIEFSGNIIEDSGVASIYYGNPFLPASFDKIKNNSCSEKIAYQHLFSNHDMTLPSGEYVIGVIEVKANTTLKLLPGTVIDLVGSAVVPSTSTLEAYGEPDDKIVINSNWNVELGEQVTNDNAITVDGGTLKMKHVRLKNFAVALVTVNNATLNMEYCSIVNSGHGIYFESSTGSTVKRCTFDDIHFSTIGFPGISGILDLSENYWGAVDGPKIVNTYTNSNGTKSEQVLKDTDGCLIAINTNQVAGLSIVDGEIRDNSGNKIIYGPFWNEDPTYKLHFGENGVYTPIGAYSQQYVDMTVASDGLDDFELYRTYNSRDERTTTLFGKGWSFNYESSIEDYVIPLIDDEGNTVRNEIISGIKIVRLPDGSICSFEEKDGIFVARDSRNTLQFENNKFLLVTPEQVKFMYGSDGKLESIEDSYGNITSVNYNSSGKISSIVCPTGRTFNFTYNGTHVSKIEDSVSHKTVAYSYDSLGQLISVNGDDKFSYEYNEHHQLVRIKDASNSIIAAITYNCTSGRNYNKVISVCDSLGNTYLYSYDNLGRKVTVTDSNNQTVVQEYDDFYYIVKETDADNSVTELVYPEDNILGEPIYIRERTGCKNVYFRDSKGNIIKIIMPDGSKREMTYDSNNNLSSEKNELGYMTYFFYDSNNKLLKKVNPIDGIKPYKNDGTDDDSQFAIYSYTYFGESDGTNLKGLIKSETDPNGVTTTYTYDSQGNMLTKTFAGKTTTYFYDEYNYPIKKVSPAGHITQYDYDYKGNLVKIINENNSVTRRVFDENRRLVKEIQPNLYDATKEGEDYAYAPDVGTRYTYDTNGNVLTKKDALGNLTSYTYDKYNNLLTETKPNGAMYIYEYDALNRIISEKFKESSSSEAVPLKTYTYSIIESNDYTKTTTNTYITDSSYISESIIYDKLDREVQKINADNSSSYTSYNQDGTVSCETDERGSKKYYSYDKLGRLIGTWVQVSGEKYQYSGKEYDKGGRVLKENQCAEFVDKFVVPENVISTTYSYNGDGSVSMSVNPLGGKTAFTYDNDGNLTKKEEFYSETKKNVTEYEYDYAGKPLKMIIHTEKGNIYGNPFDSVDDVSLTTTYLYDKNENLISVKSPLGTTESYTYDALNNQLSITNNCLSVDGQNITVTSYKTYDANGNVLTEKDYNGNTVSYEYDKKGQLIRTIDASGGVEAYYYDNAGRETAIVSAKNYDSTKSLSQMSHTEYLYNRRGKVIKTIQYYLDPVTSSMKNFVESTIDYDEIGNVTKESDASGFGTEYTYDYIGNVLTKLDQVSKNDGLEYSMKYTFDALGRKLTQKDAAGTITEYKYDNVGNILSESVTAPNSNFTNDVVINHYDLLSRLIKAIDACGNVTTYQYNEAGKLRRTTRVGDSTVGDYVSTTQYNADGEVASVWDSVGKKVVYSYDSFGRKIGESESNTSGQNAITKTYRYDKNGNLVKFIDGNNNAITYTYDANGNRTSQTLAGKTKTFSYDKNGNQVSASDYHGNSTISTYDPLNRLVSKTDAMGNIIEEITYNNNSQQITSKDALGNTTTYSYDQNGRLKTVHDPENNFVVNGYDKVGNLSYKVDENGNTTYYSYDEYGNLLSVTNPLNEITSYTYDGNGNTLSQTDASGNTMFFEYNAFNQKVKTIYPGGRTGIHGNYTYDSTKVESYTYSPNGNKLSQTDRNGNTTEYTYDVHGRLLSTVCGGASISYSYDNNGNMISMTDNTGTTTKTYDAFGRVLTKSVPDIGTVRYAYDDTTDLQLGYFANTVTNPDDSVVKRVYDKTGKLYKLIADGKEIQYNYYNNGNVSSVVYNSGVSEEYTYFADNKLSSLVNKAADGSVISSYSYTYDAANNQLSKTDLNGTDNYTYDSLGRIITESLSGGTTINYSYDPSGNRISSVKVIDNNTTQENYAYDTSNKLVSVSESVNGLLVKVVDYTNDYNGNNLKRTQKNYENDSLKSTYVVLSNTFDKFNQLVQSVTSDNKTVVNTYNGEGRRVKKQVLNGSTTKYLYDGDKVIAEFFDDNSVKAVNVYGLNLVLRFGAGSSDYYMYNGHADVTALINASNGATTATYDYDSFGNILSKTGLTSNSVLYAGYQYDTETGLYYLNSRMYDPVIARFLQEDTYGGNPKDPLSLNRYTYCSNSPLVYYDPTGHVAFPLKIGSYNRVTHGIFKNANVKKIQKRLQNLGYLSKKSGTVTSKYNKATYNAVKKFQKRNGIKATGNVNKTTWNKMFNSKKVVNNSSPTSISAVVSSVKKVMNAGYVASSGITKESNTSKQEEKKVKKNNDKAKAKKEKLQNAKRHQEEAVETINEWSIGVFLDAVKESSFTDLTKELAKVTKAVQDVKSIVEFLKLPFEIKKDYKNHFYNTIVCGNYHYGKTDLIGNLIKGEIRPRSLSETMMKPLKELSEKGINKDLSKEEYIGECILFYDHLTLLEGSIVMADFEVRNYVDNNFSSINADLATFFPTREYGTAIVPYGRTALEGLGFSLIP